MLKIPVDSMIPCLMIKPTNVHLASKELLQRCLRGATQNANWQAIQGFGVEFLPNSGRIWRCRDCGDSCQPNFSVTSLKIALRETICKKLKSVPPLCEIAVNPSQVLQFNNRAKAVEKVLEDKGSSTRFYMEAACVWEGKQTKKGTMKVRRKEGLRRAGSGPGRNNIWSRSFLNIFAQSVIGYSNPRTVLNPQYRKSCTTPGLHTEFLLCATLSFTTYVDRQAPDDRHKSWNLKLRKEETPCAILVLFLLNYYQVKIVISSKM